MRCLVCKRKIGSLRRLVDQKYCCDDHRKRAAKRSARALRDAFDNGVEEPWLITAGLRSERRASSAVGFGTASGLVLVVAAIILVMLLPSGQRLVPPVSLTPPAAALAEKLEKRLPGQSNFSMREDFRSGLRNWVGDPAVREDWSRHDGFIRPGRLRLWKPTLSLVNYQLEFQGQIDEKAIGWAFRAANLNNYYATKIRVTTPGPAPRVEIVRFIVMNGHRLDRVQLPLPLPIRQDTLYEVKVNIKAHRFSTVVNGQVVDNWTDSRFRSGGVGFFTDPGERAELRWVSVSHFDSILHQLLSFSFLIGPRDLLSAGSF